MLRLSFIVPVHNVEMYLEQCILSLYNQNIPVSEYEIICVDDCSEDSSSAVLERLLCDYPSLRVIHLSENRGPGGARNAGMEVARGVYVWFVDSDDFLIPNVLKLLLDSVEASSADILLFDYISDDTHTPFSGKVWNQGVMTGESFLFENHRKEWIKVLSGPWRQIFRRKFLIGNQLSFVEKVLYEDMDFLIKSYLLSQRVMHLPMISYHYRYNSVSTTHSSLSPRKLVYEFNQMERCAANACFAENIENSELIRQMVADTVCSLRQSLVKFSLRQIIAYLFSMDEKWVHLKYLVSKKTWLAIRYGVITFSTKRW